MPLYCALLEQRFQNVGVVCADYVGGSTVAIKLRGDFLKDGSLRPEQAHAKRPVVDKVPNQKEGDELRVEPDIEAIAADALVLGLGLAKSVEFVEL